MINIDKKSIVIKISSIMLVVIISQALIILISIWASGVVTSLSDNAYSSFREKILTRKNYLQNEMQLKYSNIYGYAHDIASVYENMCGEDNQLSDNNTNLFLENATPHVISMLRATMATGSFIILDNNVDENSAHSTVYIKDSDPHFNTDGNTDLYLLRGPVEVSRSQQISLEKTWKYGITLDQSNKDIFYKPYNAASQSTDLRMVGYWAVSPNIGGNGINMLTYTIPLINSNNEVFGLIGIELTQDYLYKNLPNNEIFENSNLGYFLAINDKNTGEFKAVLTQGALQKSIFSENTPLSLELKNEKFKIHTLLGTSQIDYNILLHAEPLKLYNNNTPFENEQWMLVGLVEETALLKFSKGFVKTLGLFFILSILVSTVVVIFVGINFVKPIVLLAAKVRKNDPNTIVSLGRTGLSEIDELSIAIENLNYDVMEVASKTDTIIRMVNLPIGTFEYTKSSDIVRCSENLFNMLDFSEYEYSGNIIDAKYFFDKIKSIKKNVEDAEKNIYMLRKDEPAQWVTIVSVEGEDSVLGVIMDVTRDVLDSHAIKFDRDYDALTQIFNRYAFKNEVIKTFEKGVKGVAAIIMLDLDNLKYINDTYGHDVGDIYIKAAAHTISNGLKSMAVVGRMSGDEFLAFLHGFNSKNEIRDLLKDMYNSLNVNLLELPNGSNIKIRMSGGITWYKDDSTDFDELLRFADFAMYQGKHTVKGEIREFDKNVYDKESFMLSGREELNKVLDNQLIEFAFQPIISARTGEIYAYESLMRPQSEILPTPLKLIQIATAQFKLWQIEKITFFKTLSTYMKYEKLFNGCKIFINSVPNEILKDSEYLELEQLYPNLLKNIVVEIIESEKLSTDTLAVKREIVKRWGGAIAVDDYGSGYNGDISLISIAPDIVKIDRLLIEGIETDRNRQAIIQKLIAFAREQNILVLAEGVETKNQLEFLVHMGVDLLQGFYIARPMFTPNFDNRIITEEIKSIYGE